MYYRTWIDNTRILICIKKYLVCLNGKDDYFPQSSRKQMISFLYKLKQPFHIEYQI